jgi:hypothetical protein
MFVYYFLLSSQIVSILHALQLENEPWQETESTSDDLAPEANEPQIFRSPL